MSLPIPVNSTCVCGRSLPWHLLLMGFEPYNHICACERNYVVREGKVYQEGSKHNPLVGSDHAYQELDAANREVTKWLSDTVDRWEKAVRADPPDLDAMVDLPDLPGNVSIGTFLVALRERI